ncbi:MAG TPA: sel1 repeat family protein [Marinobacter sp.]|nr:sel1 repeat family protein [Marinobacter sp.]
MHITRHTLKAMALTALIALTPLTTQAQPADDQTRVARDMIRVLEAYAVYKMGQYDLAFERYKALAEDGNRQGMLNVANMYAEGKGVERSDANAFQWYLRLAESGDRIGMEETAEAYRTGTGVQEDPERALYWEGQ